MKTRSTSLIRASHSAKTFPFWVSETHSLLLEKIRALQTVILLRFLNTKHLNANEEPHRHALQLLGPGLSRRRSASRVAPWTAFHGVGSQADPRALVGECSIPVG